MLSGAGAWPYLALFALSAGETSAFLGFVIPGEGFVIAAGVLAARGDLNLMALVPAVVGGAVIGDSIGFWLGRRVRAGRGRRWLGRSEGRMARVQRFFARRGPAAVFLGRFVGFARPVVPFAAGVSGMPYRRFLAYGLWGAGLWGLGSLAAGFFVGEAVQRILPLVGLAVVAAIAGTALGIVYRARRRGRVAATAGNRRARAAPPAGEVVRFRGRPSARGEDPLLPARDTA